MTIQSISTGYSVGKSSHAKMLAWGITAVFPLVLLFAGIYFRIILGDFPNDPDYAYLLNGINILRWHAPAQIDHPGTPVRLVAGLISGLVWLIRIPFNGWISPADDAVLHPELYLLAISLVLIILSSVALFALGWCIFRGTGSLISAAVAQVFIFFSYTALSLGLNKVAPEGLLLPLTVLLAAALVRAAFPSPSSKPRQAGMIVGALIGACLVTKTNSAPLIFAIFIFRERKIQLITAGAVVLSAILFTLPVAGRYGEIFGYNWRMLTHTGRWGLGEQAMIAPAQYLANVRDSIGRRPRSTSASRSA